jgi:hypothetical protein
VIEASLLCWRRRLEALGPRSATGSKRLGVMALWSVDLDIKVCACRVGELASCGRVVPSLMWVFGLIFLIKKAMYGFWAHFFPFEHGQLSSFI